jgi:CheY-like chemotaxis protein
MDKIKYNLLLADDDTDDCIFFREALEDLPITSTLTTVNDGAELMRLLYASIDKLPDILFLDLNMPRKTGYECITEIKLSEKLKHLPVIVFSTSLDRAAVNLLYEKGAHYYIRKPGEFSKLKQVIHKAILLTSGTDKERPPKEDFVLNTR